MLSELLLRLVIKDLELPVKELDRPLTENMLSNIFLRPLFSLALPGWPNLYPLRSVHGEVLL